MCFVNPERSRDEWDSPTRRLAAERERAWLREHGQHDYRDKYWRRDEAMQECADIYNCSKEHDPGIAEQAIRWGDELARRMEATA